MLLVCVYSVTIINMVKYLGNISCRINEEIKTQTKKTVT